MSFTRLFRSITIFLVIFSFCSVEIGLAKTKKKSLPVGTPILWRQPDDIQARDLYLGAGGTAMQPDLRRVTLIKEEKGGYSKKYRVKDASGNEWVAKIGKEAQSETAAVRLLWAVGYETEINYLVPRLTIAGKGTFQNVRLEARPKHVDRLDQWQWKQNPFVGSNEFQGLKLMMALVNNWDLKDTNNKILFTRDRDGNELQYIISDLGATFGHAGSIPLFWRIMRSRNNPGKYAKTTFIKKVKGNRVEINYHGKNGGLFNNITVEDARWLATLLSQLSDRQLQDAFRAANYSPADINLLSSIVRRRAEELMNVQSSERLTRK